ncbi:TPA: pilus assembly protein PilM [Neisseria meningitidis]|uniref:type IV pilus biogenesis protein PilM n=1 Tax=Neisseria meningitidis TaxID=487 RepID=UPI000E57BE50|nr:type IV pilus biogenesis protein PilM [Neisseria meningitidis]
MRLFKSLKNPKKTDAKLPKKSSGLNNRAAIGIDIDQHFIKMVQLSGRSLNQIQLEKYVIAKLPKNIIQGNKVQNYDQLVTYLQQAYAKLGTSCKNIIASVPQNLATIEQLTYTDKDAELDLQGFVESSISEVSSISLEEANYDYQVLSQSAAGEAVLAVASRKDEIEPLIDAFNAAGMKLSALDVDIFGQYNAYALWINHFAPELAAEKVAIFGVYAAQTYALVIQDGKILYKQETSVSEEQLNQLIQRTYQVTEEKAEEIINSPQKPSDYQESVANYFNQQITQEIQRVLQFYYTTQTADDMTDIKHILLTGEAARQKGIAQTVASQTNADVQCVHPARYFADNLKTDKQQFELDAPTLTRAFGLAVRGL